MDDSSNTIIGWVLAGGIAALGLSIGAGMYFNDRRPDRMGYPIPGVEAASAEGAAVEPIANRLAVADVAAGQTLFARCAACHTITQGGPNSVGPNLWGVVGKPHGHLAGFAYSEALRSVPGPWTFEALDHWLESPRSYAPGTKMTFAGLSDPQDRANLIAYLNAQGSNLPLPAPEASPTAGAEADGNATDNAATGAAPGNTTENAAPATGGASPTSSAR